MTIPANRRTHLVERAFQAMGGSAAAGLQARAPDPAAPADRAAEEAAPASSTLAAPPGAPPPPGPVARVVAGSGGSGSGGSGSGGATALPGGDSRQAVRPPSFEQMRQAGLVNAPDGTTRMRLAEEFSVVHHQLLRTIRTMDPPAEGAGRGRRVVLVTSARPGEGKTFCSLNIAVSIAHGRSAPVLLVDADGKHGSLSDLLGLGGAPGLRQLAADPSQAPAPLLVPTEQRNLSILPYGAPAPGSTAVPPGTTIAAAVQRLSALLPQHVIILDAPPCLSTSDPSSLAPVAGQVLLVVEAERTQRSEVEAALDMVEACPVLQLMLNQTRMNSSDTFGAYGAYAGYGVYGSYGAKPEAGSS